MLSATVTPPKQTQCVRVRAPTRVDIAGGTLDISPIVPILQERFDLWHEPICTINAALNTFTSVELKVIRNDAVAMTGLTWEFCDGDTHQYASGISLDGQQGGEFPLARAVVRYFWKKLLHAGVEHIKVTTSSQVPRGSGLGGSSSLVVGLLAAFFKLFGEWPEPEIDGGSVNFLKQKKLQHICFIAQNLEAGILGNLAGNQDHYAAAFGGIQVIRHGSDGSHSSHLATNGNQLVQRLVLAYSQQQHFSAYNNWTILQRVLTGDLSTLQKLVQISHIAQQIVVALKNEDWNQLGCLMSAEWAVRKTLADGISTPTLDAMEIAALHAGASGAKVCGAGGGGVLVACVGHLEDRSQIEQALKAAGGIIIHADFSHSGITFLET